jgi:arginase
MLEAERGDGDQLAGVAASHEPLVRAVEEAMRGGERPVSVAGDCCQSIAVVAGLQRAGVDPVIVWLDAHGDFNTWETSPSAFIGGMPLAMLVGRGEERLMRAAGTRRIPEADVILTDARDLDPGERDALERSDVRRTAEPAKIPRMVPPGRPVYVHLDLDIIDPVDAPAVHYPVKGGPTAAKLGVLLRELAATGQVVAASLTLWDLSKDVDRKTETVCLGALHALVGGEVP